MKSDRNKVILVVALLVVAGAIFFYFGRDAGPLPNSIRFVCVATGEFYDLARDDVPSILPAKNPDTGEATLLPVVKDEDGTLHLNERYAYGLIDGPQLAEVNRYVDPQTFEILELPRQP